MKQRHVKQCKEYLYRPVQALRVPGSWGTRVSRQSAHEGCKVVSTKHRPPLPPGNIRDTHFSGLLQGHSAAGRIKSIKNPKRHHRESNPRPSGRNKEKKPYFRRWSANNNRIWKPTINLYIILENISKHVLITSTNKTKPMAFRERKPTRSMIIIYNKTINKWTHTIHSDVQCHVMERKKCEKLAKCLQIRGTINQVLKPPKIPGLNQTTNTQHSRYSHRTILQRHLDTKRTGHI